MKNQLPSAIRRTAAFKGAYHFKVNTLEESSLSLTEEEIIGKGRRFVVKGFASGACEDFLTIKDALSFLSGYGEPWFTELF